MNTIRGLRNTSIVYPFDLEYHRSYPVRTAGDDRPVVFHPVFEHTFGEVAAGNHDLHAVVDVVPGPIAEAIGFLKSGDELVAFLEYLAEPDLFPAVLFRKGLVQGLFNDRDFALRHGFHPIHGVGQRPASFFALSNWCSRSSISCHIICETECAGHLALRSAIFL